MQKHITAEQIAQRKWFHSGDVGIEKFLPYTHFGTLAAAKDRMRTKQDNPSMYPESVQIPKAIYQVSITIHSDSEILPVNRDWLSNRAQALVQVLMKTYPENPFYKELRQELQNTRANSSSLVRVGASDCVKLNQYLLGKGVKVISYINEVEDGNQVSLSVVDPEIIREITVLEI